jgi:hypothetical protein
MDANRDLLNQIDAVMELLASGQPSKAQQALLAHRLYVCETVLGRPIGYTCQGCGTNHSFSLPPRHFVDGTRHCCTKCGQANDLWRGQSFSDRPGEARAVQPLSGVGQGLLQSILGPGDAA